MLFFCEERGKPTHAERRREREREREAGRLNCQESRWRAGARGQSNGVDSEKKLKEETTGVRNDAAEALSEERRAGRVFF
jgi:hypothetical protein